MIVGRWKKQQAEYGNCEECQGGRLGHGMRSRQRRSAATELFLPQEKVGTIAIVVPVGVGAAVGVFAKFFLPEVEVVGINVLVAVEVCRQKKAFECA